MQITNLKEKKANIKKLADYTADYYGFDFIEIDEKKNVGSEESLPENEKIHILKSILEKEGGKKINGTKLFFYNKPILKIAGKKTDDKMVLDIVNLETAVAEALVIKTAIEILKDEGYTNITVKLNSIGGKDSQKNFKKKLTEYYREIQSDLRTVEKKKKTTDPFDIYYSNKEYLKKINENAPTAIDNLTANSYDHFKKVMEYIDNFGVDYFIDSGMVGEKRYFSKIIFKIFAKAPGEKEEQEVAFGGRYDELAGKTLRKKKISAVGLHLSFKQKNKKLLKLKDNLINIHLLKIGSTAELKFLDIVDVFRKINVPLKFSISEKKISSQLEKASNEKANKLIILGEKEAKSDKIIVRDADDYSQKEMTIKQLEKYVKKIA